MAYNLWRTIRGDIREESPALPARSLTPAAVK